MRWNGYEYRKKADDTWVLVQVRKNLVLRFSPESVGEPEVCQFREIFHLSPRPPRLPAEAGRTGASVRWK